MQNKSSEGNFFLRDERPAGVLKQGSGHLLRAADHFMVRPRVLLLQGGGKGQGWRSVCRRDQDGTPSCHPTPTKNAHLQDVSRAAAENTIMQETPLCVEVKMENT